jgi:alcohol dehydrogenase class IV
VNTISLNIPAKLVFGNNCLNDFIAYFSGSRYNRVLIVADQNIEYLLPGVTSLLRKSGKTVILNCDIVREPSVKEYNNILKTAESEKIDSVVGIGGGSVLDTAKLTAALCYSGVGVENVFGNGRIHDRKTFLACIPTTAGTGSEMSPNAILFDEESSQKTGIISPFLVPDAAFIDPVLTYTTPTAVTASTGIDALTHCIEAYANRNAHPLTDLYALEGIRLIYSNLETAFRDGNNAAARESLALGSMYGGICLGPVNTAAVHALAYPLGSEFHLPHGISNAILLPYVLQYNLSSGEKRYANIARAIGVKDGSTELKTAKEGVKKITELCRNIGIPDKLYGYNVPVAAIPSLAKSAFGVQRLLKNNLRPMSEADIRKIYYKLF